MYESEECYYALNNNYIEYESNGDKDKVLSVREYLDMIRQYLSDIINDHKTQGEWKVQLTMEINDYNETRTMHTARDNRNHDR